MVFGIRDYRCPFARFRLKMTSEMIANGRFWTGVPGQDRAVLPEMEKNPRFDPPIEVYFRRIPSWIQQIQGRYL